jgi:hypothetical protein
MSVAACVAWLKTSLPLPTSLRTLVNVSSRFDAGLDRLVVDAGLVRDRRREVADLLRGDVRRAARWTCWCCC